MDRNKMGQFLADLRKGKDMRQQDEAEIFSVSPQAVSKWESGETIPDITTLEKISSFYSISIDEILKGEKKKEEAFAGAPLPKSYYVTREKISKRPQFASFIYSMSFLFLFLLFSFVSFAEFSGYIYVGSSSVYITYVANFYQMLFKTTGSLTFISWLIFLGALFSALSSLGFLYVKSHRKAFWVTRLVLGYVSLALLLFLVILGISNSGSPLRTGVFLLFILLLVYMILIHALPMNRLKRIRQEINFHEDK